jgi:hypothetical protein
VNVVTGLGMTFGVVQIIDVVGLVLTNGVVRSFIFVGYKSKKGYFFIGTCNGRHIKYIRKR